MKPEEIELLQHYQMRSTGEPVFVIGSNKDGTFSIKRPIQSVDNGISYVPDTVYAEELETHQQATDREIQQLVYREKTAMEAQANLQQNPPQLRPQLVKPN